MRDLSCPTKAGHPVSKALRLGLNISTVTSLMTGSPAFAGDDAAEGN